MTVVVQGFGNVGSYLAQFLHQEGATVVAISDSTTALYNAKGIDVPAAVAYKAETARLRVSRTPRRSRTTSSCCSSATSSRRARSTGDHRGERGSGQGVDDLRGRERPGHAGGRRDPRGRGHPDPAGRPRERGRRRRLVLRVGARPPGVLLERGRGQREAQRHRQPRVRRDVGDGAKPEAYVASRPTGWRCSASPKRP